MSNLPALNVDILSQIFILCVAPQGGTFLLNEAPWTLGQVCRHWRDIVLNTPLLWNSIHIKDSDAKDISRASAILIEALRRSATSKLHLHVSIGDRDGQEVFNAQPLFDIVRDRCEDWETLGLYGYCPVPVIIPLRPQLTSLRRFDVEVRSRRRLSGKTDTGILNQLFQIVQKAPLVEALRYSGIALPGKVLWPSDLSGKPWPNLRQLELNNYEEAALIAILSSCSQLECLNLSHPYTSVSECGNCIIHLPRLKSLVLHRFFPTWWTRVSLPGIQSLTITVLNPEMDVRPLMQALKQWGSSLRSISFIDAMLMDVTIEQVLGLTPFVTTFTITGTLFPYIFDRLASDASLLPRMEALVVRSSARPIDSHYISPPLAAVIRLVEARAHTLKSATVETLSQHAGTETVDRLRAIQNHGIATEINILKLPDSVWIEMQELVMLMSAAMAFHPWFGEESRVKNPEEICFLCTCLLDVLEDEDRYTLDLIKKYYRRPLHDLIAGPELPGEDGARIKHRFKILMDKWESIAT
ncbi:hypothetical protein WG66_001658 [Moniliophthora roreri]|nr:hypothetical protein WG66_001658 [Moniliophthora roreri]